MKFRKESVTVNGREVLYWQKNREQKPIIVFLHGFPGSHKGLVDLASNIQGHGLIIPDLPACGQSGPLLKKHSLKNYAKWVNDFLQTLAISDAIIVGHSFGARVALVFAVKYPQKINALVLITPVVKVDSLVAKMGAFYYRVAKIMPSFMQREWLSNKIYCGIKNRIILKSVGRKKRRELAGINIEETRNLSSKIEIEVFDEFYKSRLILEGGKIDINTLIVASDKDEIATVSSVKGLRKRFTHSELKVMKNSGHLVPLERPLATAKIIQGWLNHLLA